MDESLSVDGRTRYACDTTHTDNSDRPIFVTAYTVGNGYEELALRLMQSVSAQGRPCVARSIPIHQAGWAATAALKARVIREMVCDRFPHRPVVWLDADAIMVRDPVALDHMETPLGVHRLGPELLTGTMYWRRDRCTTRVLDRWVQVCDENPAVWDQRLLGRVLDEVGMSPQLLEPEYCWIDAAWGTAQQGNDISAMYYGGDHDPVIVHTQASRRLRKSR